MTMTWSELQAEVSKSVHNCTKCDAPKGYLLGAVGAMGLMAIAENRRLHGGDASDPRNAGMVALNLLHYCSAVSIDMSTALTHWPGTESRAKNDSLLMAVQELGYIVGNMAWGVTGTSSEIGNVMWHLKAHCQKNGWDLLTATIEAWGDVVEPTPAAQSFLAAILDRIPLRMQAIRLKPLVDVVNAEG